jgi:excisionase family DNA binding protein
MDKDAYTIPQFCERHGISRSGLYNALKNGEGPRVMKVGNRVLISREAAEAWRREREQAAEQAALV